MTANRKRQIVSRLRDWLGPAANVDKDWTGDLNELVGFEQRLPYHIWTIVPPRQAGGQTIARMVVDSFKDPFIGTDDTEVGARAEAIFLYMQGVAK